MTKENRVIINNIIEKDIQTVIEYFRKPRESKHTKSYTSSGLISRKLHIILYNGLAKIKGDYFNLRNKKLYNKSQLRKMLYNNHMFYEDYGEGLIKFYTIKKLL